MSDQSSNTAADSALRRGFCIFLDTFFQGPTLAVTENENSPCVFATEADAQREIVDNMMIRLQEFLDGERDFDDAITLEEYVVSVTVLSDGSVVDEGGRCLGKSGV